jgi:AbrB family looped-hinge helix DNA binding protein
MARMKLYKLADTHRTKLTEDGAVILPPEVRDALGLRAGDVIIMAVEDGELRLWSLDHAIKRAQEMVRRYVPEGVSLVDELIAERHAEAERE